MTEVKPSKPRVVLLAGPQSSPSVLFGLYDVLYSVGSVFPDMTVGVPGENAMSVEIVSRDGAPFRCLGNILVEPHAAVSVIKRADAVIVCDMYTPINVAPVGAYPGVGDWLRRMHAGGALVASVCSGALVLAEAGLLDGRETAAHWAYGELFSKAYPKVRMRKDSILCLSEEADRIVTAGGVTSWQDLAIYLIERFCGARQAQETARIHVLQRHDMGQLPFASMNTQITQEDAVVAECQRWISRNFERRNPVEAMTVRSGLPPRTFARRFKAATGRTPIDYVQSLRIEKARLLLETGQASPDDIAVTVGYEDPASFRRLFRSRLGLSPAAYRKKFVRRPEAAH